MLVGMGVRRFWGRLKIVTMRVMGIVQMFMLVLQRLVSVLMVVPFAEMQPEAEPHQYPCNQQASRQGLPG